MAANSCSRRHQWTRDAQEHLRADRYLLIEAQAAPHEQALRAFAATDPRVQYIIAAAGGRRARSASRERTARWRRLRRTHRRVGHRRTRHHDRPADQREAARGPYLIKLDTYGFELPILAGATNTLPNASALINEAYNLRVGTVRCASMHCAHGSTSAASTASTCATSTGEGRTACCGRWTSCWFRRPAASSRTSFSTHSFESPG
jgi:hypothetical protein